MKKNSKNSKQTQKTKNSKSQEKAKKFAQTVTTQSFYPNRSKLQWKKSNFDSTYWTTGGCVALHREVQNKTVWNSSLNTEKVAQKLWFFDEIIRISCYCDSKTRKPKGLPQFQLSILSWYNKKTSFQSRKQSRLWGRSFEAFVLENSRF